MRIALLESPPADGCARTLAARLHAAGRDVTVLVARRPGRRAEAGVPVVGVGRIPGVLGPRKLAEGVADAPALALAVRGGGFDVAHAFAPAAALAATWANAGASVLTFTVPLRRERLSDRRLRLAVLERAVERVGAVVARDRAVQASVWRWLGLRADVLAPDDASGYAAVYAAVAGGGGSR